MPFLVTVKATTPGGVETRLHMGSEIYTKLVVDYCISHDFAVMVQHMDYATAPSPSRSKNEVARADVIMINAKAAFFEACKSEFGSKEGKVWLEREVRKEAFRRDTLGT